MKWITALFFFFLFNDFSFSQKNNQASNQVAGISIVNGKYKLNTTIILSNQNLQALIDNLNKSNLQRIKKSSGIPVFIKIFLINIQDDSSFANAGENWNAGCGIVGQPHRQLIYFGLGNDIALFTYYSGGLARMTHTLIFKFKDQNIIDFWCGFGIDAANKKEILNYLQESKDKHWGLNTNGISL